MSFTPLNIEGVWLNTPEIWSDDRGSFNEVLRISELESQLGRQFQINQINQSTSLKGVFRGIHWADSTKEHFKYVFCSAGRILDFFVDLRPKSSTFKQWNLVELDSQKHRQAILMSRGIGHGFLSLEENSVVTYLTTLEYEPKLDRNVNVNDQVLEIHLLEIAKKFDIDEIILSEKDRNAPGFAAIFPHVHSE